MFPVSHSSMVIMIGWIQSELKSLFTTIDFRLFLLFNRAGERTVNRLNRRPDASKPARLFIVPNAGHQMMIDNPDGFHEAVRKALDDHQE